MTSSASESPHGFAGKAVLVTGATSGIGAATALAFARRGANLLLVGRDRDRGAAVCRDCTGHGVRALFHAADLARPEEVRGAVAAAIEAFGRLDIAFNNAGYQEPRAPLAEQPDAAYDRVFDTHLRACFHAMTAEHAQMLTQGGGVIVNNASGSGLRKIGRASRRARGGLYG